jgi:hypothetical protein
VRIVRWRVRCALGVYLIGFAEGTCAHLWDLAHGGVHAYAFAPVVLQVFFTALVVLDPLVIVLLARARPAGVTLAAAVMAADVTANWIADWPLLHDDPNWLWRPVGLCPSPSSASSWPPPRSPSTEPSPHARPGARARSVPLGRLDEGAPAIPSALSTSIAVRIALGFSPGADGCCDDARF